MKISKMIIYIKELDKEIELGELEKLTLEQLRELATEIISEMIKPMEMHLGKRLDYTVDLIPANMRL